MPAQLTAFQKTTRSQNAQRNPRSSDSKKNDSKKNDSKKNDSKKNDDDPK